MLLFQKARTFSAIFIAFMESTQEFAHFEKKDRLQSLKIFEVIELDDCGYFNVPKLLF